MRRKKLFLIAALAITTGATARDIISVTTNKQECRTYAPGEVTAITFSGHTMQVNKQGGTDSYRLADVDEIIFSLATGVYGLKADGGRLTLHARPGENIIHVQGYDASRKYQVGIFSASGREVKRDADWRGQPIDLTAFAGGVYNVKINETTFKFSKFNA